VSTDAKWCDLAMMLIPDNALSPIKITDQYMHCRRSKTPFMKNARHNKKISCFKTCFFIGSYAAGMDNSDAPYYFPLE